MDYVKNYPISHLKTLGENHEKIHMREMKSQLRFKPDTSTIQDYNMLALYQNGHRTVYVFH
jgi:hypothetical protein